MNVKYVAYVAVMFLIVCGGYFAYADVYHYSDRIEVDGEEVLVQGDTWTDSQNGNGQDLTNTSLSSNLITNYYNLSAYWAMEAKTDTMLFDDTKNNHLGTMYNMNTGIDNCTGTCSGRTSNGKIGNAITYDGVNDYITTGTSLGEGIDDTEFTVMAWMKLDSFANYKHVVSDGITSGDTSMIFGTEQNNNFRFYIQNDDFVSYIVTLPVSLDDWTHFAGVYNKTHLVLYKNGGESISVISHSGTKQNGNAIFIGARNGDTGFFNGTIDEVKIFDKALSIEEIIAESKLDVLTHNPEGHLYPKTGGTIIGETYINNTIYIKSGEKLCWNADCTAYEYWNGTHKIEVYP